jgi:hypothetical protein
MSSLCERKYPASFIVLYRGKVKPPGIEHAGPESEIDRELEERIKGHVRVVYGDWDYTTPKICTE